MDCIQRQTGHHGEIPQPHPPKQWQEGHVTNQGNSGWSNRRSRWDAVQPLFPESHPDEPPPPPPPPPIDSRGDYRGDPNEEPHPIESYDYNHQSIANNDPVGGNDYNQYNHSGVQFDYQPNNRPPIHHSREIIPQNMTQPSGKITMTWLLTIIIQ